MHANPVDAAAAIPTFFVDIPRTDYEYCGFNLTSSGCCFRCRVSPSEGFLIIQRICGPQGPTEGGSTIPFTSTKPVIHLVARDALWFQLHRLTCVCQNYSLRKGYRHSFSISFFRDQHKYRCCLMTLTVNEHPGKLILPATNQTAAYRSSERIRLWFS